MSSAPLARVASIKVKLGLLVVASATVAAAIATLGRASGVPVWLSVPVTVLLALAVTQLLATGMTAPLRTMTVAARRMATGDYSTRVTEGSADEVGELARAFNTMAADLAAVDLQRRELVANVSHELRTPLAGLCAVLENLADGVSPRDPESLRAALGQAERMAGLVEDLLDLARVDAGRAPLTPEPLVVAELLADAVSQVGVLGRDVTFDVHVEPADLEVRADPARLHQLVANLLDNASRHSPAGGTVRITAGGVGERWWLEVHDEGPGIPVDHRERVLEPFGTLSGDGAGGGTGLGLAIARWVSDLHGGSLRVVDPGPGGVGARVRLELPLDPPDRTGTPDVAGPAMPGSLLTRERADVSAPDPTREPAPARAAEPVPVPELRAPSVLDDLFGRAWPDRGVPARLGVLLGAVGVGLLAAVVLPFRDLGAGTSLVLLAAGAVVLAASTHRGDRFVQVCGLLCALLALVPVLRDAEWISLLCLLAGAALCVCAVARARTATGFVLAGLAWPLAGLRGLPWLGRTLALLTGLGHGAALLRTVVLSALALLVFGALSVSADALLAEWVDAVLPDLRADTAVLRAFLAVAVGGTVLAAAYLALNPPAVDRDRPVPRPVARRFEWLAPVLVVVAVFAALLAAQATVVFGGHGYLERTTGLTYAEYVHQGFGQLTVATALTLLVVWAASRKASRVTTSDRAWLRVALGLLCGETLVVVASALYRMHVYQEAYGFTRLRLLVDVFEGWLGLLVLAVLAAGWTLRAAWLPRFALLSGVAALLGLALLNPDAWIAERNLERWSESGRVDWAYLRGLSDDAVPALAERVRDGGDEELADLVRRCALAERSPSDDDPLEWNLGRARAADLLGDPPPDPPTATSPGCPETR